MKLIRVVVSGCFLSICAVSLHAQPATVQQLQLNRDTLQQQQMPLPGLRAGTNAPELYQGENVDTGPQRILRLNPRNHYFDVLLDSQVFFTDNANFATPASRIGSAVYVNTIQLSFSPTAMNLGPGKFAPQIGFSSQWYNYDSERMQPLDFDAQTVFVAAKYGIGKWQASLGANYTRLLSQHNYDETYREFLPAFSVQRFIPINDTMILVIGDQVDYHFTKVPGVLGLATDLNDHFDNAIFVTFNWQLTKHFTIQPFYRFQYSYFRNDATGLSHRDDNLNALGITLLYNFNKYISARVFCNYNTKTSDDPNTPNYDEINGGVGGSLDIKF